jgi:hypothetical protein
MKTKFFMLFLSLLAFNGEQVYGYECNVNTYGDETFVVEKNTFYPEEKIYVKASCVHLPAGAYKVNANWTRLNIGTIRNHNQQFEMNSQGDRTIYFWMKLSKKGRFTRMLNNSDYNEEYYGDWRVDIFLNDIPLPSKAFIIN